VSCTTSSASSVDRKMRSAIAIARPAKASYAARSAPRSPRAIRAMISSSPSPAAAATRIQSKCTAVKHPAGSVIVQALPAITRWSYGREERTDSLVHVARWHHQL